MSNSVSINDIESKYGINMTTCTKDQLDALTSNVSNNKKIKSLDDLMISTRQFDINNMSDIERANLKYLLMSTDEMLEVLSRKAKSVYYKPSHKRLRWLMSYEDFYQTCAYKLLLNDGILRFNANYKLECAIQLWFNRVAWWKSAHRVKRADEVTVLDSPCNSDSDTTLGDIILKESSVDLDSSSIDANYRIKHILSLMSKESSNHIVIKAGSISIPMSEYIIAKLFLMYNLGKKELSKMMYNSRNNKLVSNQIFNKFYKNTLMHISELLNDELNEYGESFTINSEDL